MVQAQSFYIAARYGRKEEALELAERLSADGVKITSTWIYQVEDEMLYGEGPEVATKFAEKDVEEIKAADGIIYLSEEEDNKWGRGGRHVEFGIAIGLGKHLNIIGPLENLFHRLPYVLQFDNADDFISFRKEFGV